MSGENIEFARRALEAFNAHDTETWIAYLDPSVEYHSAITVADRSVLTIVVAR